MTLRPIVSLLEKIVAMFAITFLLFTSNLMGQKQVTIRFNPTMQGNKLILDQTYVLGKDSMTMDQLKFYISNIELYNNGKQVKAFQQKEFFMDYDHPESFEIFNTIDQSFDSIRFNLGIDSLTSVSGVFGGDLDPLNGMYWTWQSGYINFKLEGQSKQCPSRNNRFNLHLGGYMSPNNALREIGFKVTESEVIQIDLSIDNLLEQIDLKEDYNVMSPGEKTMTISNIVAQIFLLK